MNDQSHQFDFGDLAPKEKKFSIGQVKYVVREASEKAATQYRSAALSGTEMTINDDDNTRQIKKLQSASEVEALLVSLCLYRADQETGELELLQNGDADPKHLVSRAFVDSLPSRVVKPIFAWIKEASELDESDKLEALVKQRDRLNAKIAKLEKAEGAAKNS